MAFPNVHNEEMDVQILNLGWRHTEKKNISRRFFCRSCKCSGANACRSLVEVFVAVTAVKIFVALQRRNFLSQLQSGIYEKR